MKGNDLLIDSSQSILEQITLGNDTYIKKTFKQRLNPTFDKCQLQHPNIVKIIEDTPHYQIQQFLPGQTLYSSLQMLSVMDLRQIFYQIRSALDYLHSQRIIHCDITPYNIMVHNNEKQIVATLIDLDRAVLLGNRSESHTLFAAPEQRKGGFVCAGTDVWGFAMTMLQAIFSKQHGPKMAMQRLLSPFTRHTYARIFGQKANRRLGLNKLEQELERLIDNSEQSQCSTINHTDEENIIDDIDL